MKDWSVTISEFSLHTSLCKNPLQLSRMCLALNMKNWYSNMCVCKSGLWEIWAASLYRTCLASSPFPFTHTQLHQMSVHSKPNRQNEMPLTCKMMHLWIQEQIHLCSSSRIFAQICVKWKLWSGEGFYIYWLQCIPLMRPSDIRPFPGQLWCKFSNSSNGGQWKKFGYT